MRYDTDIAVVGRGLKTGRRYDLRTLRVALGKTQSEVARVAEMSQGDVSRLEDRLDVKLSTLERYASALGGEVDVAVVIGGRRYRIDLGR
jgi:predicted transcriptional regulator